MCLNNKDFYETVAAIRNFFNPFIKSTLYKLNCCQRYCYYFFVLLSFLIFWFIYNVLFLHTFYLNYFQ